MRHFLFKRERGDELSVSRVEKNLPKRMKQRRKVLTEDGVCFVFILFLFLNLTSHPFEIFNLHFSPILVDGKNTHNLSFLMMKRFSRI